MDTDLPILRTAPALDRIDQDTDLYKGLVSDFFTAEKNSTTILKNYYRTGDYEHLRSRAHRMKGVLMTLGADKLGNICMQIERMIKEDRINPPTLAKLMSQLPTVYAETEKALNEFISQL